MTAPPARPARPSSRSTPSSSSRFPRRSRPSSAQLSPSVTHALARPLAVAVVHDDGVRRCPELIVGELLREAELRLALTDPASGEPLNHCRARSDDDPDAVARLAEVAVEQLDRLHNENRVVGEHRAGFEHAGDHPRMEDLLEAAELRGIAEDFGRELRSVDLLVLAEHLRPER